MWRWDETRRSWAINKLVMINYWSLSPWEVKLALEITKGTKNKYSRQVIKI